MKIIFLNTWYGALHDELRAYVQKNLNDTAVFCFQEADTAFRSPYEDLLATDFILHETRRLEEDGVWRTNATYVRREITVAETGGLFVEQTGGLRPGLAGFITILFEGKRVTICNIHGAPQPGHKLDTPARLYQTETLLSTFKNHEAVIIGGDFNLLPESKSVHMFAENGYRNLIADFDIQSTRNRYAHERYPDAIQHYADYVFTSPAISVASFVIPGDIVSDHQPLELLFEVN